MISEGYKNFVKEKINEYILENNKIPTRNDIEGIVMEPLIAEYGSWKQVLIEFGFIKNVSSDELFNKLLNLQLKLGYPLTMADVRKDGINVRSLIKKFGSWSNLKQELSAHLPESYKQKKELMDAEFLNKLKQEEEKLILLTKKHNKVPTANLSRNYGININRLLVKYKTWNNVKRGLKLEEKIEKS